MSDFTKRPFSIMNLKLAIAEFQGIVPRPTDEQLGAILNSARSRPASRLNT